MKKLFAAFCLLFLLASSLLVLSKDKVALTSETTPTTLATTTTAPPTTEAPATTSTTAVPETVPTTTATTVRVTTTTTTAPRMRHKPRIETVREVPSSAGDSNWDRLAMCESGNTNDGGAPYYGYFQFDAQTWRGVGEQGLPNQYSRSHQLAAAKRLHAKRGWAPWPGCSRELHLR